MSDYVTLDVAGVKYSTTMSTLTRYPESTKASIQNSAISRGVLGRSVVKQKRHAAENKEEAYRIR